MDHREDAVRAARELVGLGPVIIDTETTGFDSTDSVIEVAVVGLDGTVLYDQLVKPPKPIPAGATAVHGINDIHVIDKPVWAAVWPDFVGAVAGRAACFYNAKFDIRLLRQSCGLAGLGWQSPFAADRCVMSIFAQYYGDWNPKYGNYRWQNLEFARKYFGLVQPNSHRARDDAELTRQVLLRMAGE
jgi:DNA polymerase-3 subunit epsilon